MGAVLEPGEDPNAERVLTAAGHSAVVMMHGAVEYGYVDQLPNGEARAAA